MCVCLCAVQALPYSLLIHPLYVNVFWWKRCQFIGEEESKMLVCVLANRKSQCVHRVQPHTHTQPSRMCICVISLNSSKSNSAPVSLNTILRNKPHSLLLQGFPYIHFAIRKTFSRLALQRQPSPSPVGVCAASQLAIYVDVCSNSSLSCARYSKRNKTSYIYWVRCYRRCR